MKLCDYYRLHGCLDYDYVAMELTTGDNRDAELLSLVKLTRRKAPAFSALARRVFTDRLLCDCHRLKPDLTYLVTHKGR